MSALTLNAVSVRHGQIEDGPYWAKIGILDEEVQDKKNFSGQQFIEYPVDGEVAKTVAMDTSRKVPGELQFKTGIKVVSGKPMMVITGLA